MEGPGGPPRDGPEDPLLEGPGGPPRDGPGGPPLVGGPFCTGSSSSTSSSSNIAPQCGHSLSDSLTNPSQTSQANISSSLSASEGSSSLPIFSTLPSFERNRLISTTVSNPLRATSVEIACSNAVERSSGVSNTLPSST